MGLPPVLPAGWEGRGSRPCTLGGRPRTVGRALAPTVSFPGEATGHRREIPQEALSPKWSARAPASPSFLSPAPGSGAREGCQQVRGWRPQTGSSCPFLVRMGSVSGPHPLFWVISRVAPHPVAPPRSRCHLPGDHSPTCITNLALDLSLLLSSLRWPRAPRWAGGPGTQK